VQFAKTADDEARFLFERAIARFAASAWSTVGVDGKERAIWSMQDRVIWPEDRAKEIGRRSLTGVGHYRERYERCDDDRWRIATSALTRLRIDFEEL